MGRRPLQWPALSVVASAVSAVLFTGYIVYDLNQAATLADRTEGDEVLLAVNVYLDILNLFLNLLSLLGGGDD